MKKLLLLLIIPFLCFGQIDYESQIQPILNAQCIGCHQGDATYSGGLNLTSYDDLMDGGYTQGGVVTTGLLEDYITTGYMPAYGSGNSLSETEINLIIQWISEGANYIENCNSDIDNDGICEDHCEEWSMTVIVDCECSFFNPNTYTVFSPTVYEESCELWEDCSCQCYNDSDGDGICDEDETEGINGCSDPEACNYDDSIIPGGFDDGSCEFPGDECEGFDQQLQEVVYGYLEENCECALPLSIDVFLKNKEIIKTVDAFGRETNNNKGFQLHIYNDGTVEKEYILK